MGRGRGGRDPGLEMTNSTGRLLKSWAAHSACVRVYETESRIKNKHLRPSHGVTSLLVKRAIPPRLSPTSCHSAVVSRRPCCSAVCRHPLFPSRFPLIWCRPVSVGPAEHIKMPPTPHCPGGVRVQLSSYETIWNTHHGGGVALGMVYM